jgi:hypothetical protein
LVSLFSFMDRPPVANDFMDMNVPRGHSLSHFKASSERFSD